MPLERACEHKSLPRQLRAFFFLLSRERKSRLAQIADQLAIVFVTEELDDALRDPWADFVYFFEFLGTCIHDRVQRTEVFRQELRRALAHHPNPQSVDDALQRQLL